MYCLFYLGGSKGSKSNVLGSKRFGRGLVALCVLPPLLFEMYQMGVMGVMGVNSQRVVYAIKI
jgi:hypothetical protein